ncbi:MAG: hypothetical protein JW929_03715 [Anaerolineales bacterium]|nr:hypothetical protein [Anaerolineales bacterium]
MHHRSFIRRHWPLLAAAALWLAIFAVTLVQILSISGGKLIYASDDVYIHMAIAKNLARHGVWGVTPYAFTSCASSILWPILIALTYVIFGVNEWSPLILNLGISILVLGAVYRGMRARGRGNATCAAVLTLLVLCVPFAAITFDGMEHVLQILVFVLFAEWLISVLKEEGPDKFDGRLIALGCTLTLIRYEGLFLAGAAALLLGWRRRWKTAAAVIVTACLPVALMALVSLAQGWYPVPNSVLIKSAPFTDIVPEAPAQILTRPFRYLTGRDYILALAVLTLLSWLFLAHKEEREKLFARIAPGAFFLMIAFAHGTLINMEWFYRHAAYLIALGVWALEAAAPPGGWRLRLPSAAAARIAAAATAVLLAVPFLGRAQGAILHTPPAARNIYEMQYQMALFLKRYYPQGPVAANDIGAVSFYNEFPLLDLYGLASMDVAREKLGGTYDTVEIARLVSESGAQVVVVYDYWFDRYGGLPEGWVKVGEWHFTDCYVCGGDTVSFYAPSPDHADLLRSQLVEFESSLPERVVFVPAEELGRTEETHGGG